MYRNLHAIGLLIALLTAFVVVDATSALAQKKLITTQITVTEDAAAALMNWPQDIIAFTSARAPLKSLNDLKSPDNWAVSGSDLPGPLSRLLQACRIPITSCMVLGNDNFPELFLKNESLRLFLSSTKTKNIDKITKSGGGIRVVFVDNNGKAVEQKGKW
jgi:hypothetical protein